MTAAVTLHPEYAALMAAGVKWVETRPGPAFPVPGVRKLPGLTVRPGERLLIHAGMRLPKARTTLGGFQIQDDEDGVLAVTNYNDIRSDQSQWFPLHPGHIVASAVLRDCVPIVANSNDWQWGNTNHIDRMGDTLILRTNTDGFCQDSDNVSDQLPCGDFTPGRWAWLLNDVKPTTDRCPACWGAGVVLAGCDWCNVEGTCQPIPAKGRQGVWRWQP